MHPKKETETKHLYLRVYDYYKELILSGKLPPASRMPSLRKCAQELELSRTTIENAYLQLAADGYIAAKAQSGYYVTDIASRSAHHVSAEQEKKTSMNTTLPPQA